MQKQSEKITSCVSKLTVINGMYPQVSCNHEMRKSGHQLQQVIENQRINWKKLREQKRNQKIFLETTARNLITFMSNQKRPNRQLQEHRTAFGKINLSFYLAHNIIE